MTEGFVDIHGGRIFFEVAGSGPPVVFIHGFSLDARMWDAQFAAFAERYQAIRCDIRGFGRSTVPDGQPYSTEADLDGLLQHLGVKRPALIGQSMGGGIAIDYAISYPDSLRALVLVDTVLGGFQWSPEMGESLGAIYEHANESGVEAARSKWLGHGMFTPGLVNPRSAESLERILTEYSGWHWANSGDDPGVSLRPPAIERLHEITVPALAVLGELDVPDFHHIVDILEANVPHARKAVLAGAGHMANMETPEEFNRIVLDFLASV